MSFSTERRMDTKALTRKRLRAEGFLTAAVEQYNAIGYKEDLWGLFDVLAVHPDKGVWLVQACGQGHDLKKHIEKYQHPILVKRLKKVALTANVRALIFAFKRGKTGYECHIYAYSPVTGEWVLTEE